MLCYVDGLQNYGLIPEIILRGGTVDDKGFSSADAASWMWSI